MLQEGSQGVLVPRLETQKHHLDAKHLGQLVVANMDHCLEA